jgi:hypothetical protein
MQSFKNVNYIIVLRVLYCRKGKTGRLASACECAGLFLFLIHLTVFVTFWKPTNKNLIKKVYYTYFIIILTELGAW